MVGAGFISQVTHLQALSRSPKCEIAAIADARSSLCKEVSSNFGIPAYFDNYEEMLAKSQLDGVVVCIARPCLGPAVEAVLNHRFPVISEKPMAHRLQDAEKLVQLAKRNNTSYHLGFMRRCDGGVELFKEKLESANLGPILHVAMLDFCGEYAIKIPFHLRPFEKPTFRYKEWSTIPDGLPKEWSKDYEYGMNVLIHDINLIRYLFGDEITAAGFEVNPNLSQTAILSHPHFTITISAGRAKLGKWDQVMHVYFEKGRLSLYLPSPLAEQETAYVEELSAGNSYKHYPLDKNWAFENQMERFLTGTLSSTGEDSLKDIHILENLWRLKK